MLCNWLSPFLCNLNTKMPYLKKKKTERGKVWYDKKSVDSRLEVFCQPKCKLQILMFFFLIISPVPKNKYISCFLIYAPASSSSIWSFSSLNLQCTLQILVPPFHVNLKTWFTIPFQANQFTCTVSEKYVLVHILEAMAQLVEALCYKPEGRGFDSRWCHWIFSLT